MRLHLSMAILALLILGGVGCGDSNDSCKAGELCACSGEGECELFCDGPGCQFDCSGDSSCNFHCPDGQCKATASGTGNTTLDCPGNGCEMICSGSRNCTISNCTSGCDASCLDVLANCSGSTAPADGSGASSDPGDLPLPDDLPDPADW